MSLTDFHVLITNYKPFTLINIDELFIICLLPYAMSRGSEVLEPLLFKKLKAHERSLIIKLSSLDQVQSFYERLALTRLLELRTNVIKTKPIS